MEVKSNVKAGGPQFNHNQTVRPNPKGMKVRSNIKAGPGGSGAGGVWLNHNQTITRAAE